MADPTPKPWGETRFVGKATPRIDAYERVSGTAGIDLQSARSGHSEIRTTIFPILPLSSTFHARFLCLLYCVLSDIFDLLGLSAIFLLLDLMFT